MFNVPVLIILYNRVEETHNVFQVLRAVQPTQLYIAGDGGIAHRPQQHQSYDGNPFFHGCKDSDFKNILEQLVKLALKLFGIGWRFTQWYE